MAELSRTQKSIRNAKVALFFSMLTFALGFFSRKILMDALGADILGLYTTASNLCGFLNLAELGITSAVAFSLYKPIFDNDRQAITEIVSIQGWLFRYVGIAMTVGAVIMMSLFPVFFNEEKTNLPLWYSYATFGVIFLSQVLGYFFCYQQTLLSADQQEYKITFAFQGGRVLKMVLQIVGIGFCGMGYSFWLIAELGCGVLTLVWIWGMIKKSYPWLRPHISLGKEYSRTYPSILSKTKQLFFHRIGTYVLNQTSPLVIYYFISLAVVAIYGNYLMIMTNVRILLNACFNGINASVGNLVAENDDAKTLRFYISYKALRYWLASIICYSLYYLTTPFMSLWIGEDYLIDNNSFTLLIVFTFISCTRTCDTFLNAYGLFRDIFAPITEIVLNLFLSILLGKIFGLSGIISGVLISLLIIVCIWKPIFLYSRGFRVSPIKYIPALLFPLAIIAFSWATSSLVLQIDAWNTQTTILDFLKTSCVLVLTYTCISFGVFYLLNTSFRDIVNKIAHNMFCKQ